jgi:small subunit ribosomal protein S14
MFSSTKQSHNIQKRLPFQLKNVALLALLKDQRLNPFIVWSFNPHFTKIRRSSSLVQIKKRCAMTGRSRSIYSFVRLSRLFLRENSLIGKIPGLRKAYW